MPENKQTRAQKMDVRIIKAKDPMSTGINMIRKSDVTEQITPEDAYNAGDWITHPYNMIGLKGLVNESTILPQCIRAYRDNIAGFGIGVKYKDEFSQVEESDEMKKEFDKAQKIIGLLNTDMDTKEVFENVIEARETYGIAYLEVIRNLAGDVVQIEFVKDTPAIDKTKPLEPYISTPFYYGGEETERKRKYCKYRETIGGQTVYFREFGDPRIMDKRDGLYLEKGQTLELEYQANEILEFTIGTMPYGEIRWLGQILGVDGSRRAESLNNNYFINGRHTPLMIMIENGTLTDEAYARLQEYMDDIKGESGQHAFMVLETESTDARTDFETSTKPTVQVKDLASILQKDELFQSYIDDGRKKVQSAFLLPDIYTGYTTDFNRATAQTAQEVTEKQVFQPERKSLAWIINNKLLNGYNFKYVEAYFLEPNISNPDDTYRMLTVLNSAGGLTMNKAKELLYKLYGETSEDYDGDWGNLPFAMAQQQAQQGAEAPAEAQNEKLSEEVQKQIEKAAGQHDDEIVAVLKEVRNLLKSEWNEEAHPRDEIGRFTGGGNESFFKSGSGDFEVTGDVKDLYLTKNARGRIEKATSKVKTAQDLKDYLKENDIDMIVDYKPLQNNMNQEITDVKEQADYIIAAVEQYKDIGGLSSLEAVHIYDPSLDVTAQYSYQAIGEEKVEDAGHLYLSNHCNGYEVMHEFAHAWADSTKPSGEDVVQWSSTLNEKAGIPTNAKAYFGADPEAEEAEKFASTVGQAICYGEQEKLDFLERVVGEVNNVKKSEKGGNSLQSDEEYGIIQKYSPDQPRDEKGQFAGKEFTRTPEKNVSAKEKYKVGEDINNVFWARYAGQKIGAIVTYNPDDNQAYEYAFEIAEFDNYNIFKKTKDNH